MRKAVANDPSSPIAREQHARPMCVACRERGPLYRSDDETCRSEAGVECARDRILRMDQRDGAKALKGRLPCDTAAGGHAELSKEAPLRALRDEAARAAAGGESVEVGVRGGVVGLAGVAE